MTQPLKIAVLVSGGGSNLQSIIDPCQSGDITGSVQCVISDSPDAYALTRASQHKIPGLAPEHPLATKPELEKFINQQLDRFEIDLIVLAGFMKVLSSEFVAPYIGRMINIHPSLLPKYPGLNTHARAIADGEQTHGATVHFVTAELDGGPIIASRQVEVLEDDSPEVLQKRVLAEEHKLLPAVIQLFAENRILWNDGNILLDHKPVPKTGIQEI